VATLRRGFGTRQILLLVTENLNISAWAQIAQMDKYLPRSSEDPKFKTGARRISNIQQYRWEHWWSFLNIETWSCQRMKLRFEQKQNIQPEDENKN
jgi:hypothetical protein